MDDYVSDIMEDTMIEIIGEDASPALVHLFVASENTELLSDGGWKYLYTMTSKLLFFSKWVHPYLEEAVELLATKFKEMDKDEQWWSK